MSTSQPLYRFRHVIVALSVCVIMAIPLALQILVHGLDVNVEKAKASSHINAFHLAKIPLPPIHIPPQPSRPITLPLIPAPPPVIAPLPPTPTGPPPRFG